MNRAFRVLLILSLAISVSLGVVGFVSVANAATITVSTTSDEYNTGPSCSLREAIQAANDDAAFGGCPAGSGEDLIVLPPGTYGLSSAPADENLNVGGDIDVRSNLPIQGAGAPVTTVDGQQMDRVFHIPLSSSAVQMSGISIRGGNPVVGLGYGGGIFTNGALTLSEVAITGSKASGFGGGVYNNGPSSNLNVADSLVSGNDAAYGGGISNSSGTANITNVTISGNSAMVEGGGIASYGGSGSTALSSVTITANIADADNAGGGNGGGILRSVGTVKLKNTLVAGNSDATAPGTTHPDCSGTVISEGHNLIGNDTGCGFTATTGDTVGTGAAPFDARLGPLADNGGPTQTHALLTGSPAIDRGNPAAPGSGGNACAATDQRGAPRNCDIGAYELVLCITTPVNRVGTEDQDILTGTAGPDGFLGLGGNDRMIGLGGNDAACGGGGNDRASGGSGKDRLRGEGGKDSLRGGGGRDRLAGGPGKDSCSGGPGRDRATCEKERQIP